MPPKRCEVDDAASFIDILRVLADHEVDLVVGGGVAEILVGSPVVTVDLDIVYDSSKRNLSRLLEALGQLNARYYTEEAVRPDALRLARQERHLLLTDLGLLDAYRNIDRSMGFGDLTKMTTSYEIEGFDVKALDLESLIEIRKRLRSPEDRYALRFLRQIVKSGWQVYRSRYLQT